MIYLSMYRIYRYSKIDKGIAHKIDMEIRAKKITEFGFTAEQLLERIKELKMLVDENIKPQKNNPVPK